MNNLMRRSCRVPDYYSSDVWGFPIVESPETAIAMERPSEMLTFLERESQRRHYADILNIGKDIAQTYLNCLKAEDVAKISDVRIKPMSHKRFFGIIVDDPEMIISFQRR